MNSKQKGKRGELEWVAYCRQQGFECRRTSQYCGKTGDASDVIGLPGIHQEVKRVEKLNIYDAMNQSIRDRKGFDLPIVAHRKNKCEWLVTMRADDWFFLYREYFAEFDNTPSETEHGANCPVCGAFFNKDHAHRKPKYCESCGSKLHWRDKE